MAQGKGGYMLFPLFICFEYCGSKIITVMMKEKVHWCMNEKSLLSVNEDGETGFTAHKLHI